MCLSISKEDIIDDDVYGLLDGVIFVIAQISDVFRVDSCDNFLS